MFKLHERMRPLGTSALTASNNDSLSICRWDEAAADYQAVLAVAPKDPSAWNNLGNTYMGEHARLYSQQYHRYDFFRCYMVELTYSAVQFEVGSIVRAEIWAWGAPRLLD